MLPPGEESRRRLASGPQRGHYSPVSGLSERQVVKLRTAQRRGYRWAKPGQLDTLDEDEWVGLLAAGEVLGASDRRLAMLIQGGRLRPALSRAGEAGFRKEALDALARDRHGAGFATRAAYLVHDLWRSVVSSA
jgi:hypothetical protein